jgi:hypothetical protein
MKTFASIRRGRGLYSFVLFYVLLRAIRAKTLS